MPMELVVDARVAALIRDLLKEYVEDFDDVLDDERNAAAEGEGFASWYDLMHEVGATIDQLPPEEV